MNPDQQIELYRAARAIAWAYKLEQYDAAALKDMQRVVDKSKASIVQKFADGLGKEGPYTRQHFQNSLKELERLSLGLREQLGEQLTTSSSRIGSLALKEWGENLSVGGVARKVNTVALSPEQFAAFFKQNPPAGILIPKVVKTALDQGVIGRIEGELLDVLREGALTGQSYTRIVDKLSDSFTDFKRHQLVTLTRTFFQTANAQAFDAVYQANQDIMEGKIWTIVNDDRVCLLCLSLGERLYKKGESHPPMPRHPNCRCVFRAKTVSFRELGIDLDELDPIVQPVVTRGYEKNGKWIIPPVGTGTGHRPRAISFHQGGMKDAFPNLPEAQQKAMLGAGRYKMYKAGELSLDQLVDKKTGRLWLMEELKTGVHLRIPEIVPEIEEDLSIAIETPAPKPKPMPFSDNARVWENSDKAPDLKKQVKEKYNIAQVIGVTAQSATEKGALNKIGQTMAHITNRFPVLAERFRNMPAKSKLKQLHFDKTPAPFGSIVSSNLANYWNEKRHMHFGQNSFQHRSAPELTVAIRKHNVGLDFASIFRHEYGHLVHLNGIQPSLKKKWDNWFTSKGGKNYFVENVSKYAGANAEEAFAETFAAITSPLYDWKGTPGSGMRLTKEVEDMMLSIIGKPNFKEVL